MGVERHPLYRLHTRRYPINHDAFACLEPESAYWIGFVMADGCIASTNTVQVTSHVRDLEHLRRFVAFAGSPNRPIRLRDGLAIAALYSPKLVDDLAAHGVLARKSKGAQASEELAAMPAFWLGVIDGDGTIGDSRAPYISLCGSRPLIKQYQRFLAVEVFDGRNQRVFERNDGLCFVTVEGDSARRLAQLLYSESPICLPRKADKANVILRYRSWHTDKSFAQSKSRELRLQKRRLWLGTDKPRAIHVARLRKLIETRLLPQHGFESPSRWRPSPRASMVAYEATRDGRKVLVWVTPRPDAEIPRSVVDRRTDLPVFVLHVSPAHPEYSWCHEETAAGSSKVPMAILRQMNRELAA